MDIFDYADALNLQLDIHYFPNQGNRFCASFSKLEVVESQTLVSHHGNGHTPHEAVVDYIKKIAGKTVKIGDSKYIVPKQLSYTQQHNYR